MSDALPVDAAPPRNGPEEMRPGGSPGERASGGELIEEQFAEAARLAAVVNWESALPPRAAGWRWRAGQRVKRAIDVVVALACLVVLSPLFALIALLVVADSRGPVLFPWRVLGRRAHRFTGYKFRTMVEDAERLKANLLHLNEMTGPVFKMKNDPRVTRLGRFLRKYSLDELPQLWSVVRGDMSLVGPRPPSPAEFVRFEPWQRQKLAVTPGITCLWQVTGRSTITDFDEWARLDLEYIQRWSLRLDLQLLLRTLVVVVRGTGAY